MPRFLLFLASIFLLFPVGTGQAVEDQGGSGRARISRPVSTFYETERRPIWLGADGSSGHAPAIISMFEQSWRHGFNPEHYRVNQLKANLKKLRRDNLLEIDSEITQSALKFISDLTTMRAPITRAERDAGQRAKVLDAEKFLETLASADDPVAVMRSFEPASRLYKALQDELDRLAKSGPDATPRIKASQPLLPGNDYPQIPEIRSRLGLAATARPDHYDDALAAAVMRFQKDHGLESDGVIGPRTLERFNLTTRERIRRVIANLERLRRIGDGRPDRYVLVNIPSATLWAVEGGQAELTMPVIVGKTARPTYSFRAEISGVRFNPSWTVPDTIKREDFLPQLRRDPYALTRRGFSMTVDGDPIDPGLVEWHMVMPEDMRAVRITQPPGPDNPLGAIRVLMDNPYDIYLHDTNHREQFDAAARNLSSGCIRVSAPEKLAAFILAPNERDGDRDIPGLLASGRMRDVRADRPIPVYITYQTIWLDDEGRLIYGDDPYGLDRALADKLEKMGAFKLPEKSVD